MSKTDTEVEQLVINIGTTAKLLEQMSGGAITENMLSISTDAPPWARLSDIGNATLIIQKNGSNIGTFTANSKTNTSIDIVVPTKTSDLTNDSSYTTTSDVSSAIGSHNSSEQAHSYIRGLVSNEVNNRQNADNNLQQQIDAITAASDVTDVVGTYAQLQAYDTSHLPNNSIIKVLKDESRNDETTYYRWVISGGTGSWVLIGEEGPYYTKSEANSTFVPQTRTVNGKALSSNISLDANDVGALPSSTVIPTVNNATLTIQKNGSTVQTFTANQSTNATANITVPTNTNELTNGAGFITYAGTFYWGE